MAYDKLGAWAFILGVVIAIIAGLASGAIIGYAGIVALVLVILGLAVGFINVSDKDITNFLIAAIALIAIGTTSLASLNVLFAGPPGLGTVLTTMLQNIAIFVAPATLVVSLKAVYNLSKAPSSK